MRVTIVQCRMLRDQLRETSYKEVAEQSEFALGTVYYHGEGRCSHLAERSRLGDTRYNEDEDIPPRTMTDALRILADPSVTSIEQAREKAAAMRGAD